MKDISYYSKDAIASRMSFRQSVGHEITKYRRHTEYGVIEIYYHIDITPAMAVVGGLTVVPALLYVGDQAFNNGELCTCKETHYFDATSGQEISYSQAQENKDKNKQADLLGREGNKLHKQGQYKEAYKKYREAYERCTSGYSNEARYKRNRDIAKNSWSTQLNKEGTALYQQNKYSDAAKQYRYAYNTCTDDRKDLKKQYICNEAKCYMMQDSYSKAIELCDQALRIDSNYKDAKNIQAETLNAWGDRLFNQRRYVEAAEKYNEAYVKCTNGYNHEQLFRNNLQKSEAELDAIGLMELGDQEFNAGRYDSAKFKYQEAYEKSRIEANKETYAASINRSKAELDAISLKEDGDQEFNAGRYDSAKIKYQKAYEKSRIETNKKTYTMCINHSKVELDAIGLKEIGDREFNAGRYNSAKLKYQEAYNKSRIEINEETYTTCINRIKAELDAIELKKLGDREFNAGRYVSAKINYQKAFEQSSIQSNKKTYATCINDTKAELDAIGLKELGDREFSAGRYDNAKLSYQEAYEKSRIEASKKKYIICINYAKAELDAIGLKEIGDLEFNAGKYDCAKIKYEEAYDKSRIEAKNTCTISINKSQVELDALSAYQRGESLFSEGKYSEAVVEYHVAYSMSEVNEAKNIYLTYRNSAQSEVNAIIFNFQGDYLFEQGEYEAALDKYQAAYHMSQITKEKSRYAFKYSFNKDEVQTIIMNKLSVQLDALWKEAWDTENGDGKSDKSEDAKEKFQNILNEAKEGLKNFPENLKFKQYETLALLKIEGNELFNKGIEVQQSGIELLQEAQKLKQQQKYQLDNEKFKDAKDKFSDAQDKFKIGSLNDQRFVSCVEFVKVQMEEVIQSIRLIEEHMLNHLFDNLNIITNDNNLNSDFYDSNIREDQHHSYEQIF